MQHSSWHQARQKEAACYADKGRTCPACPVATTVAADRQQMEAADHPQSAARPWRFNELKKDLKGISQKVLTDSLRISGGGRHHHPNRLPRSAAPRGVRPQRPGNPCAPSWTPWSSGETTTKTRDREKSPDTRPCRWDIRAFPFYKTAARGKAVRRKELTNQTVTDSITIKLR